MARWEFEARARADAPRKVVWEVLAQGRRWAEWGPWDRAEYEREGDPPPDGVGAIRAFTRRPVTSREQVTRFEPPQRLGYALLSGLPIRGYAAEVTLTEDAGGTEIVWRSGFEGAPPGMGRPMRAWLRRVIADVATRLAREAERRARG